MPVVQIRLLGPFEVEVSGVPVELRRKKQRALIALLALRPGEAISTDRLVEDLWGHEAPKAAVGSLQNLVSQLRKALGTDTLLTRAPGYVLDVSPELVDLHRFQRLVEEAVDSGAADARAVKLRQALELWRGPALADLAYEPFAQAEIARLEEMRLTAREELLDAELELGRHGRLVGDLEALVAEHPLRERLRAQLMTALYRSGRQADALDAYRQARETLVEELGIDPSPELQQLEQAILRHDPELDLSPPGRKAAARETDRRKTVTILFADLVDSTDLGARLDPEVLRGLLNSYYDLVRAVVERHGGVVEKFIGDAAMAAFGIPTLHEDDALRAIRAASELQVALAELNAELADHHGVALHIRIGVNTGEVFVSDSGSGEAFATGAPVNLAMRLEQAALAGEILLGEATYRLVRHAVEADELETLDAGSLGRVGVYRLRAVGEAARPLGTASLVGRAEELAWVRAALAGVQAERKSRVVTVLGDAGVGKTRLATEFVRTSGARALVGRCVSYGEGATYLPLAEIVRQAVPERPRAAIAAMLADDDQAGLIAERVTELTGEAEGAASTGEVFWAVRRFLEALALEHPLVVVLEDIHWAEPTLLDLVEYLDSWSAEAPLLLLCLARRELLDDRPGWGGVSDVLDLDPLAEHDAGSLVSELAGEAFDATAQAKIVQVAEGNPLFLEQLLAFAEEAGTEALAAVPPTVEALLAGRLGRLDPAERALLERAAVVGRDFARSALIALSPPEDLVALDSRLAGLGRRGLIRAVRGGDDDAYRFHHVLIRDVAYSGVTKQTRADVHERYGTWLEQRDGPDEIVGHHFERAHDYAAELRPSDPKVLELAEWAGQRLGAAGLSAFKRADTPATINLLGRAAALLPPDHEERVSLLSELGLARWWGGDKIGAESALSDAASHAAEQRDEPARLRAEMELGYLRLFTDRAADPARLLTLTDRATEVFEMEDDERALGRAWRIAGHVRGSMGGQCGEWVQAAERARTYYRRAGWSPAACLLDLAAGLFHGPTPVDDGIARCEALLAEGTDRIGRAHILVYLGGLHGLVDQRDQALELLAEAQQVYRELDDTYSLAANGGRVEGRVHVLSADLGTAEQVLRDCAGRLQRLGDEAGFSSVASELGQVLYAQGRYADAGEWAELAEAHAPRGDIIAQFAWRTLRAKALAQGGRPDEADALVREALSIVERTDLLTHHGEVCVDAAHVAWLQDRHEQAAEQGKRALELFDAKDNTASADRARAVLDVIAA